MIPTQLTRTAPSRALPAPERPRRRPPEANVGDAERGASIAAGSILALFGAARRSLPGLIAAGIGGALIYRGATGRCAAYEKLGIDTAHDGLEGTEEALARRGIRVEQAFLIQKSPEELYRFWRDFRNLPTVLTHVESVKTLPDNLSRWTVRAPLLAGGRVEWDAEIVRDEPNSLIAWRSLPDSQVKTAGEIRFARALGDRGSEVRVHLEYLPPAGKLGHWAATLFGHSPWKLVREDLRSFKRLMELGEIPTVERQPRGTCTGVGWLRSGRESRRTSGERR